MMRLRFLIFLLSTSGLLFLNSCNQTCDNIPSERKNVQLRVLNSVVDRPLIYLFIDSAFYDTADYNLANYPATDVDLNHSFGLHSRFVTNNAPLVSGTHHFVFTSDAAGRDTLKDTTMLLNANKQTFILTGRANVERPASKGLTLIYLNDEIRSRDLNLTLIRFVHCIPDLKGIDVYFSNTASAQPDLSMNYTQISGTGTGRSPDDYISLPVTAPGLLVTERGNPKNIIVSLNRPLGFPGFIATAVIRGTSNPVGVEPIASVLVLNDSLGTSSYTLESFGVRFVNATRGPALSLLLQGWNDLGGPNIGVIRESTVWDIGTDSVSGYLPLNPYYHGNAKFFFSTSINPNVTQSNILYSFTNFRKDTSAINIRYSIVAMNLFPLGQLDSLTHLVLVDTAAMPGDGIHGRVRFVNTSPDHTVSFNFQGTSAVLAKTQFQYFDAPFGQYTVTFRDGATQKQFTFNVPNDHPVSVFIMADQPGNPMPVTVVKD